VTRRQRLPIARIVETLRSSRRRRDPWIPGDFGPGWADRVPVGSGGARQTLCPDIYIFFLVPGANLLFEICSNYNISTETPVRGGFANQRETHVSCLSNVLPKPPARNGAGRNPMRTLISNLECPFVRPAYAAAFANGLPTGFRYAHCGPGRKRFVDYRMEGLRGRSMRNLISRKNLRMFGSSRCQYR